MSQQAIKTMIQKLQKMIDDDELEMSSYDEVFFNNMKKLVEKEIPLTSKQRDYLYELFHKS